MSSNDKSECGFLGCHREIYKHRGQFSLIKFFLHFVHFYKLCFGFKDSCYSVSTVLLQYSNFPNLG